MINLSKAGLEALELEVKKIILSVNGSIDERLLEDRSAMNDLIDYQSAVVDQYFILKKEKNERERIQIDLQNRTRNSLMTLGVLENAQDYVASYKLMVPFVSKETISGILNDYKLELVKKKEENFDFFQKNWSTMESTISFLSSVKHPYFKTDPKNFQLTHDHKELMLNHTNILLNHMIKQGYTSLNPVGVLYGLLLYKSHIHLKPKK